MISLGAFVRMSVILATASRLDGAPLEILRASYDRIHHATGTSQRPSNRIELQPVFGMTLMRTKPPSEITPKTPGH